MNIYQRIAEVAKQVTYVQKDASVGFGNQQYKAVTHDQVTGVLRAAMLGHGILCTPSVVGDAGYQKVGETKSGTPIYRYSARFDVTFVSTEDGSTHVCTVDAHADDHGDKAPGKALSYAVKSAMLKVFLLETGENDEARYQDSELTQKLQKPAGLPPVVGEWYDRHGATDKAYTSAVVALAASVECIKFGLTVGPGSDEYEAAAAAWFELDDDEKRSLWKAPSKGGVFTTHERDAIKSTEFRVAHFGTEEQAA